MLKQKKKLEAGSIIKSLLRRGTYPVHVWNIIKLQRGKKRLARAYDDPQLKLYADVLQGDFLNYGYFEDPEIDPRDISLNDILRAQRRHAELVAQLIVDRTSPVLDVGCGMGGLVRLMLEQGLNPVALSPDKNQIRNIKEKYPQIPVLETRFEDIPIEENMRCYGTVITSESLQYLKLDQALPLLEKLLKPGGKWIAFDYFRTGDAREKSGHVWTDFEKRVVQSGWKFVYKQDNTLHVLPTLKYIHMWGNDIVNPLLQFALGKGQRKQPGMHYMFEEVIDAINKKLNRNLDMVSPEAFAACKRYMLVAMERE